MSVFLAAGVPAAKLGVGLPFYGIYWTNGGGGYLPGVNYEDVKVHFTGDALLVEGERKYEKEEKREGYAVVEPSGCFVRICSFGHWNRAVEPSIAPLGSEHCSSKAEALGIV